MIKTSVVSFELFCGVRHLLNAIIINAIRMPVYALKTFGVSISVSLFLISSEICSLLTIVFFDVWGCFFVTIQGGFDSF